VRQRREQHVDGRDASTHLWLAVNLVDAVTGAQKNQKGYGYVLYRPGAKMIGRGSYSGLVPDFHDSGFGTLYRTGSDCTAVSLDNGGVQPKYYLHTGVCPPATSVTFGYDAPELIEHGTLCTVSTATPAKNCVSRYLF